MKKIITAGLILMCACISSYGQNNSQVKKIAADEKNYGPYTVTMDDGKMTIVKNPNFDWSKVLKRDTTKMSSNWISKVEIYKADSNTPILKNYLIYDLNSISSERLLSKEERMSKYSSQAGVTVIHLKPGVILLNIAELLNKFKAPKESLNLPLFVNYRPIAKPNEILAVPDAVLTIDVVTDNDGVRFLNVITKKWNADIQKNAGKVMMYSR